MTAEDRELRQRFGLGGVGPRRHPPEWAHECHRPGCRSPAAGLHRRAQVGLLRNMLAKRLQIAEGGRAARSTIELIRDPAKRRHLLTAEPVQRETGAAWAALQAGAGA